MNREAARHLGKAKTLFAKGEEFYRKAAVELAAAKEADTTLTNKQIGDEIGRHGDWVRRVLKWHESDEPAPTPFVEPERETTDVRGAKRVLAQAPLEQVEQIISTLPRERKLAISAELGNAAAKQRHEFEERERTMPPAERKEREAIVGGVRGTVAAATAGFDTFGIVNHLEQATSLLGEMVGNGVISTDGMAKVDAALAAFLDEYRVAMAMTGQEATA